MRTQSSISVTLIALLFLSNCTIKQLGSALRSFDTKELRPVTIGNRRFAVEERSRVHDLDQPARGDNITIAVYATVNGQLVHCGTSRSGCRAAITEFLYGYNPDTSTSGIQDLGGD